MSNSVWWWAHLQCTLLLLSLVVNLRFFASQPPESQVAAIALVIIRIWLLKDEEIVSSLLPYTGWLSITSMLLLLIWITKRITWLEGLSKAECNLLITVTAILGLILYPTSLWFTTYSAYNLGFSDLSLPLILGLGAIIAWWVRYGIISWLILYILWMWLLNLGESQNLWDYMLDPWLVLYAWYQVLMRIVKI